MISYNFAAVTPLCPAYPLPRARFVCRFLGFVLPVPIGVFLFPCRLCQRAPPP